MFLPQFGKFTDRAWSGEQLHKVRGVKFPNKLLALMSPIFLQDAVN